VGLCGWAAIFLVFHVLLGVQLFPGFLFELI
jgi:hypothetical protein